MADNVIVHTTQKCNLSLDEAGNLAKSILKLERDTLPKTWNEEQDEAFLVENILSPESIVVVASDTNMPGRVIGLLLYVPYASVVDEIRRQDPLMPIRSEHCLYVETIVIHPAYQRRGVMMEIIWAGIARMVEINVRHLALHARIDNGFARYIQRFFRNTNFTLLERRLVAGMDYTGNEPTIYLEVKYTGS